jgi:hypothetical protein
MLLNKYTLVWQVATSLWWPLHGKISCQNIFDFESFYCIISKFNIYCRFLWFVYWRVSLHGEDSNVQFGTTPNQLNSTVTGSAQVRVFVNHILILCCLLFRISLLFFTRIGITKELIVIGYLIVLSKRWLDRLGTLRCSSQS